MTRKNISFDRNPLFSGPSLEVRSKSSTPFRNISISEIDIDTAQPRRNFETESLAALAASIKEFGVLCPVLVRVTDKGTYKLVAGERRLRACKILGLDSIPAVVDKNDGEEKGDILSKQLIENLQREDLSPLERAQAIGQLKEAHSLSVRDISKRLGLSKSLVQRSLEILALSDDLQAALASGLSESKVLLLKQVNNKDERRKILSKLEELTRTQLENLIAAINSGEDSHPKMSHGGTASDKKEKGLSSEDLRLINDLQRSLSTKVQIVRNSGKKGQGKLTLEFYSEEDLAEIYKRLVK